MKKTIRFTWIWFGRIVSVLAFLFICAWFLGRIVSDRYLWSQWLLWIPTPAVLLALFVGLIVSFRPGAKPRAARNRVLRWGVCALSILCFFLLIEHRFFRSSSDSADLSNSLRVVHWNITGTGDTSTEQLIQSLINLNGDITVITDPNLILRNQSVRSQLSGGRRELRMGTIALLTRFPFRSIPPVISTEGINVFPVEIDTTEIVGRNLVFYLVDLPSDPTRSRMELANKARGLLDRLDTPSPDVVVGDLNLTRGSASIRKVFSGMRHAFDEAGSGYGASFPRWFPVYHIDHILLGDDVLATRYEIIDQGIGRHCMQAARIRLNSRSTDESIDHAASFPTDAANHP